MAKQVQKAFLKQMLAFSSLKNTGLILFGLTCLGTLELSGTEVLVYSLKTRPLQTNIFTRMVCLVHVVLIFFTSLSLKLNRN